MPFESKPLNKGKIESLIKEQENIVGKYDQTENIIINGILNELPDSINTASLAKFCKNKVDKILENYPDKKDKADIIRNQIQKEIIFDLYNEKFLEIKDAIEIEKPSVISPQWIRERFPAIALLFRRTIKNTTNNVDWNFISKKLGIKDIFKYQEKQIRNEKEAIEELEQLLEKENPEKFSPIWIERNNDSIHTFLKTHFKDDNNKTNWPKAISGLSKKWVDKWEYRESERDRKLNDVIDKLIEVLKEKNPKNLGLVGFPPIVIKSTYIFKVT